MVVVMANTVCEVKALDKTLTIPPKETLSIEIYLNASSGVHGDFWALNESVNFAFIAPDGAILFASNNATRGSINFVASKAGTYSMHFSNPSNTQTVLIALSYSIRSWHNIAVWMVKMEVGLSWVTILRVVLNLIIVVIKPLSDLVKRLRDKKAVMMQPLVDYKSPELPLGKMDSEEKEMRISKLIRLRSAVFLA